jgi:hypothetical protein
MQSQNAVNLEALADGGAASNLGPLASHQRRQLGPEEPSSVPRGGDPRAYHTGGSRAL